MTLAQISRGMYIKLSCIIFHYDESLKFNWSIAKWKCEALYCCIHRLLRSSSITSLSCIVKFGARERHTQFALRLKAWNLFWFSSSLGENLVKTSLIWFYFSIFTTKSGLKCEQLSPIPSIFSYTNTHLVELGYIT